MFESRPKDIYWMLSNQETRQRMRCKLIENLQFNSHFEASRLRDHSGCSTYIPDSSTLTVVKNRDSSDEKQDSNSEGPSQIVKENPLDKQATDSLTQKLQLNKEAINPQINEDIINDEEFLATSNSSGATASTHQPVSAQQSSSQTVSAVSRQSTPSSMTSSVVSSTSTTTTGYSSASGAPSASSQPAPVQPPKEYYESQLEEKEKLLIKSECELITVTRIIKGRFELTNRNIYFFDTFSTFYNEQAVNSSNDASQTANYNNTINACNLNSNANNVLMNSMMTQNGSFTTYSFLGFNCNDFDSLNDFKIPLNQLREVQLRRYNLRRSALEFFLIDQSNFFINFNKAVSKQLDALFLNFRVFW